MILIIVLITRLHLCLGHGAMVWPYAWPDEDGKHGLSPGSFMKPEEIQPILWFSNWTFTPGEATLDPSLYTVPPGFNGDTTWDRIHCFLFYADYDACIAWYPTNIYKNPWKAPGTAPIFSPCGVFGGNPDGCGGEPENGECPGGGSSKGPDALDFNFTGVQTTEWKAGSTAEVGWGMLANHGGGYSYRLCPRSEELTEECFQKNPLHFASENSWVQYGWDSENTTIFQANRTTEGTFPVGSEWTKNPIPVCNETAMGWIDPDCPNGYAFPPPGPGLHGTGEHKPRPGEEWGPDFLWNIMDEVAVPEDLEPREYVLSFRWDCEATPQVWNSCANIRIVI
jgi:hypothetical protein